MCVTLLNESKCHQHLGTMLQIKIIKCFTFGNVLYSAAALKLLSTMISSYIILHKVAAKSSPRFLQLHLKERHVLTQYFCFLLGKVLISWA